MFALFAFAAVLVLLIALAGPGYSQSWAERWGTSDR
jgi:cell division protein FtsW (lipid II flippase)